jgi:hypothetical protein
MKWKRGRGPLLVSLKRSDEAHRLEEDAITSNDQGKR